MLKLKAAFFAPYPYWPLILAVGAGPTVLAASISRELLTPALIVCLFLQIVIFGRILSQVLPDKVSTFWGVLREYGLNYLIAGVLVGVVAFAMLMVISSVLSPHLPYRLISGVVKGVLAAITIYVWPLVFLKRSSVAAILDCVSLPCGFKHKNNRFRLWAGALHNKTGKAGRQSNGSRLLKNIYITPPVESKLAVTALSQMVTEMLSSELTVPDRGVVPQR